MNSGSLREVLCSDPDQFACALAECEADLNGAPLFILFIGSKNKDSGVSWCPDCVVAEPVIKECLGEISGGCRLLLCPVDKEPFRNSPDYIYRCNNKIDLKCVPTLMKWIDGLCSSSLNDEECQNRAVVRMFVQPVGQSK